MSTPVQPVAATPAPAPKLSAIQIIEQNVAQYIKQHEQAIANIHALEGAIQAGRQLLAVLKAEEEKAVAEAKKLLGEAKAEVEKVENVISTDASKVIHFVEAEAKKL